MFHHLFRGLSRHRLCQLAVMFPLPLKLGLAHLDRQLVTVGEHLPETLLLCFVLEMFVSLVVQLLMVFQSTIASSSESVDHDCDVPTSPQASVSVSVLPILAFFSVTP